MIDDGLLAFNWAFSILSELVKQGVQNAIISPGSRSTPLVLAASQIDALQKKVVIDERSAAFQALGIAKATAKPVLLICTSGTAAANYFPAIVEANLSRIPLILLTADRPSKLRNVGAQQTIDQVKLYGNHASYFDLGEPNLKDADKIEFIARHVMYEASKAIPVHVNAPFCKPLEPKELPKNLNQAKSGDFSFVQQKADVIDLLNELQVAQKPVFIFGPTSIPSQNFLEIYTWAKTANIPCICEALSQLPTNMGLLEGLLRNEASRIVLKPDLIVRFGRQPVSTSLELFLQSNKDVPHLHLDYFDVWHDATFSTHQHLFGDFDWSSVLNSGLEFDEIWSDLWEQILEENRRFRTEVLHEIDEFTDGKVHQLVSEWNQFDGIHISNSFPIRDIELFTEIKDKKVYCNRGANGIDGVLSTALGNSIVHDSFLTLIGDVAFLHDATSLINHIQYKANHTLLVINNQGGRIFEMLPVAKQSSELFAQYFQTNQTYSVNHLAQAFGIPYFFADSAKELKNILDSDFKQLRIIECFTSPEASLKQRNRIWASSNH